MDALIDFSIEELKQIIRDQLEIQSNLDLSASKIYDSWLIEWKCYKQIERIKSVPDENHDVTNTAISSLSRPEIIAITEGHCKHDYNPLHHSGFIVCEKCNKVYVNE